MKKKLSILLLFVLSFCFIFVGCDIDVAKGTIPDNKTMKVHYIDVGQGDSILIQVNDKNMLIDCGPRDGKDKFFSYLESQKITKLDYVVATHPHEDHIGNMADVIKKYDVNKFYAPKVEHTTKTFEKMVEALVKKNLKITTIKAGTDSIDLGENTKVSVVAPNKDTYDDLNNYSPIIKIEYGNNSFLFTGDAESKSEKEVLKKGYDVKADVLKLGHHGSSTSTSKEFFEAVNPSIGVISLASDNKYGHPHKETLNLLKDKKIKVYRTDVDGTTVLSSDGNKISNISK